jgi:hypothetical protein
MHKLIHATMISLCTLAVGAGLASAATISGPYSKIISETQVQKVCGRSDRQDCGFECRAKGGSPSTTRECFEACLKRKGC